MQPKSAMTLWGYCKGFGLSVLLTLAAYWLVVLQMFADNPPLERFILLAVLVVLALVQFSVQLVYFLHLAHGTRPRWNLLVFWAMVLVVVILAFGSLWIMQNLGYHMSGHEVDQYIRQEEGIGR
jgi:cytochrome o ubiquinol oxidase subunit IV